MDKVKSRQGGVIVSIILGFGLAALFRSVCKDKNCYIYYSAQQSDIEDKVVKEGDKCYSYSIESKQCDSGNRVVQFEQ